MPETTGGSQASVQASHDALAAAVARSAAAVEPGGEISFREIIFHFVWTTLLVLGASFWWYAAH
jgi:hypothetical protein